MSDAKEEPIPSTSVAVAPARHDGWDGTAMASFLETLAETGIVAEACDAANKSRTAAYALRRRDPLFAAAWETALGLARERLADTLLARSLEGNVEQVWKDGELVGEKHYLDNRLGLAVLRRLDERADPRPARQPRPGPARPAPSPDWDRAVGALRSGDIDDLAAALDMVAAAEVDEVDNPLFAPGICQHCGAEIAGADDPCDDPPVHCWVEGGEWWTDFPPPDDFADDECGHWGMLDYKRLCTDHEIALLEAGRQLDHQARLADASAKRDRYFADHAADLDDAGGAALVERIKAALSQAS